MEKVTVVIIDSGVDMNHPKLKSLSIRGCSFIDEELNYNIDDKLGHGTAVTGIIASYVNTVDFYEVKIFNTEHDHVETKKLVSVLDYIYRFIDCKIVNLSLGVSITDDENMLYEACNRLIQKGVILVSAHDNLGSLSYPACFSGVIGVAGSSRHLKNGEIEYVNSNTVNVLANGANQRVCWTNPTYLLAEGSSFACAHVTGILLKNIMNIKSPFEAFSFLKSMAKNIINCHTDTYEEKVFLPREIGRLAIFPFNKEMHSLVRFQDMLIGNLEKIYDFRLSGRVSATTNNVLNIKGIRNFVIESIENIDYSCFDTMIIGHLEEASAIAGVSMREPLIEKCLANGKRVYCFDDLPEFCDRDNFYHPKLNINNVMRAPEGRLYRLNIPIIGVFGTSSRQGKFTLQLHLRKRFLENGYAIGQIGTEPTAPLYGMDYCFHYGYHSQNPIHGDAQIEYVNYAMKELEKKNEVIIVGGQSALITSDTGNLLYYNFPQYEFFMSCSPDATILVVNTFDSIEIIKRTIKFIESATFSKVIALVVFPLKLINPKSSQLKPLPQNEYHMVKEYYETLFNIPTYILGDEDDMNKVFQDCIDYF